jgi:bisphosphoglycerate-independent phosphoglycerate mutase
LGGKGGGEKIFLGSLGGRFYAMDRDKNYRRNWEGLQVTLHPSLIHPFGDQIQNYFQNQWQTEVELSDPQPEFARTNLSEGKENLQTVSQKSYETDNYDETIEPRNMSESDLIAAGDTVWIVNFRTDRVRQTTQILVDLNQILGWNLTILGTNDFGAEREQYLSSDLDNFDPEDQAHYFPIFKSQPVQGTLAETISKMGKTQLHIAETEKYNHVTFFLNGGQDIKHEGEEHQLIPSNKVKSHAEKPEMKTKEVADYILENYQRFDYIVVNFACPDMVGHTGDVSASLKTLEFLDEQFGRILEKVEEGELDMVLIADHGNIEVVGEVEVNGENYIDTAHNPNPVPCVFIKKDFRMDDFYESLNQIKEQQNLPLDVELVKSAVAQRSDVNLIGNNDWLKPQEIPEPQVPLWYSGAFLLSI